LEEIPLKSGVSTDKARVNVPIAPIQIRYAVDEQLYNNCLVREGITKPVEKSAYFAQLDRCREAAKRSEVQIRDGSGVRLAAGSDDDTFQNCMHGRPPLEIEVEFPESKQ
jgi:hypothetical protein